jgi:hypothetical protein
LQDGEQTRGERKADLSRDALEIGLVFEEASEQRVLLFEGSILEACPGDEHDKGEEGVGREPGRESDGIHSYRMVDVVDRQTRTCRRLRAGRKGLIGGVETI